MKRIYRQLNHPILVQTFLSAILITSLLRAEVPPEILQQSWYPQAPPLQPPSGPVIKISTPAELYQAAASLQSGTTILLTDGHYSMSRTLTLQTDQVTLRGGSGNRSSVVLDFANSIHGEGIAISHAAGVTIANLTIQNVTQNGIKINSDLNAHHATIYNIISHNIWQRHIKGPKVPDSDNAPQWVNACRVQYCLFYNDRPKQHGDDPWEDANQGSPMGYNYIGGIDIMNASDWTISDNVFLNIHGKTAEARGAIFLWHNCRNCIIERNIIIDCDTGIALGNSSARGPRRHCNHVIVRNNFITRCPESNIVTDHTRDCIIIHNSIHDPDSPNGRLLRVVHANDNLIVKNNLFSGPRLSIEGDPGPIDLAGNLIKPIPSWFVDPARGNLHLTPLATAAIDQARPLNAITDDIDLTPRHPPTDIGADEFIP